MQEELGITKVIDPLAGSYYVENLTNELTQKAWELIQEVENLGGMTEAVSAGLPKSRIEESAAKKQAAIDQGLEVIVGVNKYKPKDHKNVEILNVDNISVRKSQIDRLNQIRATRDNNICQKKLEDLENICRNKSGNILEFAVDAARNREPLLGKFHQL